MLFFQIWYAMLLFAKGVADEELELLVADLERLRRVVLLLPAMPMATSSIYTNRCREVERSKR